MSFCVRSIRIFSKFSGDPHYEPLSWFMILFIAYSYIVYACCNAVRIKAHADSGG